MNKKSLAEVLIYRLITIRRFYKRLVMVSADVIVLPLALWSAYALRLSEWWPESYLVASWWLFIIIPFIGVCIFTRLGLYRAVVRFMGSQAIWAVCKGVMFLALFLWASAAIFQISPFPRSVPVNFALTALVYVGGSRLLVRHYYHWVLKSYLNKEAVLIYGAGGAGVQLATALSDGREYYPVGFIDDDSSLWNSTIKNLPVFGVGKINDFIEQHDVAHILLALPNSTNKQRKKVLENLSEFNIHIQTIPSMPDLLSGQASVDQLRDVEIEDLLGRDIVPPIHDLLSKCINGKVVTVTGAGGSIGSELCRQVLDQSPKSLILFDQSEYNLYRIEQELILHKRENGIAVEIIALLGSVTDRVRVRGFIRHFGIDTVYHAAAYKHVPLVEKNIVEGVINNVLGTHVVAEESLHANVSNFILVSTDKAVRPTNIMGATKRFSELVLQSLSLENKTTFSMVRFGNVLGSSGSVVPLFRRQIKEGGPITVTHKDITRFFMTIPEAASLVIQAGSMAEGGDVFVLDMGEPIRIVDLAERMIKLSGLEIKSDENPDGDIEIHYTGLRPAEKLYEELLLNDHITGTEHAKIMKTTENSLPAVELFNYLKKIDDACRSYDVAEVKNILTSVISGYQPHEELVDHVARQDNNVIPLR